MSSLWGFKKVRAGAPSLAAWRNHFGRFAAGLNHPGYRAPDHYFQGQVRGLFYTSAKLAEIVPPSHKKLPKHDMANDKPFWVVFAKSDYGLLVSKG
jgi:hypothetical protein